MSATSLTVAWLLSAMLSWSPPGRALGDGKETVEEGKERYEQIATSLVRVAYDKTESSVFGGKFGRARTAMVMLSIAFYESAFRRDVDLGIGKWARGGGTDSCLMQIRVGKGTTSEGWSHGDLVGDREKCFRAGLHKIRQSFLTCRSLPNMLDKLSGYTHGYCFENNEKSRKRIGKGVDWYNSHRPTASDEEVKRELWEVPDSAGGSPGMLGR